MEQDRPSIDSILDFLYVDTERLKVWLAQLDGNGVPTALRSSSAVSQTSSDETTVGIHGEGGKNVLVLKAEVGGSVAGKQAAASAVRDVLERQFDASWALPLNVLDRLDEINFIRKSLQDAPIGSVVLVSGTTQILDLDLVKNLFLPGFEITLAQTKQTHANKEEIKMTRETSKHVNSLLHAMPASTQINMNTEDGFRVWAPAKVDGLKVTPVDLALQHGAALQGRWYLLAIVEASPDGAPAETGSVAPITGHAELMSAALEILGAVRNLMGRPQTAYGLLPLMLFRVVKPS